MLWIPHIQNVLYTTLPVSYIGKTVTESLKICELHGIYWRLGLKLSAEIHQITKNKAYEIVKLDYFDGR